MGLYLLATQHMDALIALCKWMTHRHMFTNANADKLTPPSRPSLMVPSKTRHPPPSQIITSPLSPLKQTTPQSRPCNPLKPDAPKSPPPLLPPASYLCSPQLPRPADRPMICVTAILLPTVDLTVWHSSCVDGKCKCVRAIVTLRLSSHQLRSRSNKKIKIK